MVIESSIQEEIYGTMPDGRCVKIFTLTNANGLTAKVMEYGAILVSVETPDRDGNFADITHGYDTLAGWLENPAYFGTTVGRFGNRIRDGIFTLDGKSYTLATNNAPGGIPCHLHGGLQGFDKALWTGKVIGENTVEFTYYSKDGAEGYPGNLSVTVTYTLNDDNELTWHAAATTDAPTIVNIIHHSYWNLSGNPNRSILDHVLTLHSDHYLPTDAGLIPTGEIASVRNTPMDFTQPTAIGARVNDDFEPLHHGNGYDHAWVLGKSGRLQLAAIVQEISTGREMRLSTDQPAIHFYTGNFLDGISGGKNGVTYSNRSAFALETEAFPDSPNQPSFPSCVLRPGETYAHTMVFSFSAS